MRLTKPFSRLMVATTLLAAISPVSAAAGWLYQKSESAFETAAMHVGFTANLGANGSALSIRCKGKITEVMYIISDTDVTQEHIDLANESNTIRLKLRVDKSEIVQLPFRSSLVDGDYVALAEVDRSLAESIKNAGSTIAAALSINDVNLWENSFSARGSTETIGKVLALCDADQ